MSDPSTVKESDDRLTFVDENEGSGPTAHEPPWRILIVDDEPEVHEVTRLALRKFTFAKRSLAFSSAYSAEEARTLLAGRGGFDLALVDVIMEEDDAGLKLVRYVREELGDKRLRIVLRTGQPGLLDEQDVMIDFEVNDYKAKADLTRGKLATTVIAALRTIQYIDELTSLYDHVKQTNKLAVIGELSAGLFHEIATPITFISVSNEIIRSYRSKGLPQPVVDAADRIDRGCVRILAITKNLKEFAWTGVERRTQVKLKALLQGAVEICSGKLRFVGVTVEQHVQDPEATISCCRQQLDQVLINLINNACDALTHAAVKTITLSAALTQAGYEIEVADSGPGVPAELRDKIFQSFFTTKDKGKGTGLGLSVCVGILEAFGGRLELVSPPGEGARFRIVVATPETP